MDETAAAYSNWAMVVQLPLVRERYASSGIPQMASLSAQLTDTVNPGRGFLQHRSRRMTAARVEHTANKILTKPVDFPKPDVAAVIVEAYTGDVAN